MILLYLFIAKQISNNVNRRWDACPTLPFYSSSDLGIEEETFSFYSGKNRLYGSRYFLSNRPTKAIVVFFHGIGGGRSSYLKEIAETVKHGYLVYAYDYTGAMQSEGKSILGLGQIIRDQEAFFSFLDKDPKAEGKKRYAMGHSWGGYGALASIRGAFGVSKIVSISGFIRPSLEYLALIKKTKNVLISLDIRLNLFFRLGKYGDYDPRKDLSRKDVQVLYIQGRLDHSVPFATSGEVLQKEFKNNPRFTFLFVDDQHHAPFVSKRAEDYQNDLGKKGLQRFDRPEGLEMDIAKATEENPKVMKAIFDFLDK